MGVVRAAVGVWHLEMREFRSSSHLEGASWPLPLENGEREEEEEEIEGEDGWLPLTLYGWLMYGLTTVRN